MTRYEQQEEIKDGDIVYIFAKYRTIFSSRGISLIKTFTFNKPIKAKVIFISGNGLIFYVWAKINNKIKHFDAPREAICKRRPQ